MPSLPSRSRFVVVEEMRAEAWRRSHGGQFINMTTILAILLLVLASELAIWRIAFRLGQNLGRDAQWVDDFIARGREDAARRDSCGRVKRRATL